MYIMELKIKISADSASDLSLDQIKTNDIEIIPLTIVKDDKPFVDGIDITPYDIFEHVDNGGEICHTTAINAYQFASFFEKASQENDAVIHISIGSKFSSCYQAATLAAEKYDNVYVVDSANLSTGEGLVVMAAVKLRSMGLAAEEIYQNLQQMIPKAEASFILDKLDYMRKGGRCSAVTAFGANLLNIRPSIEVVNGSMQVAVKYRGSYKKCLFNYIQSRLCNRDDIDTSMVFVTYSTIDDDLLREVVELVRSCVDFEQVICTNAGCTVSCHCGPGTVGVLFFRK